MEDGYLKRYSKAEALKVIRNILKNGAIIPSSHVRERMLQRDFDMQDVLNVLRTGAMNRGNIRRTGDSPEDGPMDIYG